MDAEAARLTQLLAERQAALEAAALAAAQHGSPDQLASLLLQGQEQGLLAGPGPATPEGEVSQVLAPPGSGTGLEARVWAALAGRQVAMGQRLAEAAEAGDLQSFQLARCAHHVICTRLPLSEATLAPQGVYCPFDCWPWLCK
jgi:hypothetical protein